MKVVIFGASGRTGHHLVKVALSRKHKVSVFVRDPARLALDTQRLVVFQGDVLNAEAVSQAVRGQDAVICALGPGRTESSTVLSEGTRKILRAMKMHRVKRLICVISTGVLGNDAGFFLQKIAIPFVWKRQFEDKKRQLDEIVHSGLDWIVVRAPKLTDEPLRGQYRISLEKPASMKITRLDLAIFIVNQLKSKEFIHKMPAVSN
jgi:putative NADH-flavin reductase